MVKSIINNLNNHLIIINNNKIKSIVITQKIKILKQFYRLLFCLNKKSTKTYLKNGFRQHNIINVQNIHFEILYFSLNKSGSE